VFQIGTPQTEGRVVIQIQLAFGEEIPSGQRRGTGFVKHKMRRKFSVYLRRLWRTHKVLVGFDEALPVVPYPQKRSALDDDQQPFYQAELAGYTWIPLVTRRNKLKVDLSIELLGDSPKVLQAKGDLDNRVKVVLDSLRMVRQASELDTADRHGGGKRLYVLLEDDSLIQSLQVTAVPSLGSPIEHRVTIDVKVVQDHWDRHPVLPLLV